MKESEEFMKAVDALEEETQRLRAQVAAVEEEKVVILKSNHDLKKEVSMSSTVRRVAITSVNVSLFYGKVLVLLSVPSLI